MPIKVKKENKVIKQKQKQSQRQVVNIKIGEVKKAVRRRAVKKSLQPIIQQSVQPVQYMYQATGSVPFQNMGVAQAARPNILGVQQPVSEGEQRGIRSAESQLQIGSSSSVRQNILGGSFIQPENIREQRALRLRQPEEPSLYGNFPNAENVDFDNPLRANDPLQVEAFLPEEFIGGGALVASKRPYARRDGFGTKAEIIDEILSTRNDFSERELKKFTRDELINILIENIKL